MVIERASLSPALFAKFSDYIYSISGIKFQESKSYFLSSKLDIRRKALDLASIDEYYNHLRRLTPLNPEINLLLNEVTINETFFYRNQAQIDAFNNQVLKEVLDQKRKKGDKNLKIWSAAASTGDEAYTMVIDLLEKNLHREFKIQIVGTDISQKALAVAKSGIYKKYAIRNIPPMILKKYFTIIDEYNYQINDEVKQYVRFQHSNLSDASKCRLLGKFDIAFCRNVLIYFDRESREKVLTNLSNGLNETGYLLVGHSENLYAEKHIFLPAKDKLLALAYQKAPKGTVKAHI